MNDETRREYHREQAAAQREFWAVCNSKQLNVVVPDKYAIYMRGMCSCLFATYLLDEITGGNDRILAETANRRPKYLVMHQDVEVFADSKAEFETARKLMFDLLKEARWHKAQAKDLITAGNMGMYHYAIEYCLVTYLKGYYDMALHRLLTGEIPIVDSIDFETLRGNVSNVL